MTTPVSDAIAVENHPIDATRGSALVRTQAQRSGATVHGTGRALGMFLMLSALLPSGPLLAETERFTLKSGQSLRPVRVATSTTVYEGLDALRVTESPGAKNNSEDKLVIIQSSDFKDGTIELSIAASPAEDAGPNARGFAGVAFRVNPNASEFECFYLRPTNGRAEDQVRRNHSTQYFSFPEYPWHRLRKESPGKYESYADLGPGEWTRVKIVVKGTEARLFLHDADQPSLIVKDLKHGESEGQIALWIGPGTEAYFSDVSVTR